MTQSKSHVHHRVIVIYIVVLSLVLYNTSWPTMANPITENSRMPLTVLTLQETNKKSLVMPVMARKAGGSWRPEVLFQLSQEPPTTLNEVEATIIGEALPLVQSKRIDILAENSQSKESDSENKERGWEDDYVVNHWEIEEPECPDGMFYHIRGKRCVPNECPGGNTWRDRHTGECVLKYYRKTKNRWRHSKPWRPYRRTSFFGKGRGRSFSIFSG